MSITAVILTYNEERHIARCINSIKSVMDRVIVVDSNSDDRTVEIATELGAEIFQNPWTNHAVQFQWALDNCTITTDWTARFDADEYLEPALRDEIAGCVPNMSAVVTGITLRRKIVFLGRQIRHGFFYPHIVLRIWRTGRGRMEQRWQDEHIVIDGGKTVTLKGDLVDENLHDVNWWINKHNSYATREMFEVARILKRDGGETDNDNHNLVGRALIKRTTKENLYMKLPAVVRPTLYFLYRYILGLGFLDGKEGFFFHFMQAYWYRMLVELKLYEMQVISRAKDTKLVDAIGQKYDVKL